MRPKWPKLANLAQKINTLRLQFFDAFFASKGYPFKNIMQLTEHVVCQVFYLDIDYWNAYDKMCSFFNPM